LKPHNVFVTGKKTFQERLLTMESVENFQ